jgi:hypothetical protein
MVSASDYDSFADAYSAENESNLFNRYYERPAMLRLAGDVSGHRMLDAVRIRATVRSIARQGGRRHRLRLECSHGRPGPPEAGWKRRVVRVDLAAPLPFADAKFDDVIASLVLHYLED